MAVTPQEEALAQKVVDESKRTAHVDTGALKRSIHYTVARGGLVFRQLFYGKYYENSRLIQNAEKIMKGVPYTIEELDEEGNVQKLLRKVASGRVSTSDEPKAKTQTKKRAQQLIDRILKERERQQKEDGEKKRGESDN